MTLPSDGIYCFIFCIGSVQAPEQTPVPDTFCSVYKQQVLTQTELDAVKSLPKNLRDRMQANDLLYLCRCESWSAPECQKK